MLQIHTGKFRVLSAFALVLVSCSHAPRFASPEKLKQIIQDTPVRIDLTQSSADLGKRLANAKRILAKKEFSHEDLAELEAIYAIYRTAVSLEERQEVILAPRSQTIVPLKSFCLDPEKAVPAENELYSWEEKAPSIPYYSKILQVGSREPSREEFLQGILWNLVNKTLYENYPAESQEFLSRLDPQARWKLPSQTKEDVKSGAKKILNEVIPEVGEVNDVVSMIEGRYAAYERVAASLDRRRMPVAPEGVALMEVPSEQGVYASTRHQGRKRLTATFYNPTDRVVKISLSSLHLRPIRSRAQRLGVFGDAAFFGGIRKTIDDALKDTIVRNVRYWFEGQFTLAELRLIQEHSMAALQVYIQAKRAIDATEKHFRTSGNGDESDAFRHFVWADLCVRAVDAPLAKSFLDAHEEIGITADENAVAARKMDLFNNDKGMTAALELQGQKNLTRDAIEKKGLQLLESKELKVLKSERGKE